MLRGCAARMLSHVRSKSAFEPGHDATDDLVLENKDILQAMVVAVAPDVAGGGRLDQLGRDAHAVGQPAHATLDHVLGAKITADPPHIDRLAAILKGRVTGDDQQLPKPRQLGNDVLSNAVTEILLFRVATQVDEWQHGD